MSKLKIKHQKSPNFDKRPSGRVPDMLILHYTGMKTGAEAIARLKDPSAAVSAHYVVDEDGSIYQLVDEADRAWHAGVSHWAGEDGVNDNSIGVEIVNPGHEWGYRAFPEAQMYSLLSLCKDIVKRHNILPKRVLGHSDVAFERKEDPGELFNWALLAEHGVGLWLDASDIGADNGFSEISASSSKAEIRSLQKQLKQFGYGVKITGKYSNETIACVKAFQRHWQQHTVTGIADPATRAKLEALLGIK